MRPRACVAVLPVAGAVMCLLLALGGAQGKDEDLFKFAKVYTQQLVEISTIIRCAKTQFPNYYPQCTHTFYLFFIRRVHKRNFLNRVCKCVCACVCVCVFVCVSVFACMCVCGYVYVCMCGRARVCVHTINMYVFRRLRVVFEHQIILAYKYTYSYIHLHIEYIPTNKTIPLPPPHKH